MPLSWIVMPLMVIAALLVSVYVVGYRLGLSRGRTQTQQPALVINDNGQVLVVTNFVHVK